MKSIVKRSLVSLSFILSNFFKKNDIRIIFYHDVVLKNGSTYSKINVSKYRQQMMYILENGFETLTFSDLNNIDKLTSSNNMKILITFDDGFRSNYELVFPIMKELNLKFNIFLEVGAINKKGNYLNWKMINEMIESGLVGIGAHTYTHKDARFIDRNNFNKEILEANEEILRNTGVQVEDFAFPFGYYNKNIIKLLDELKVYKRLYTIDCRPTLKTNNTIIYGRVGISDDDSDNDFISKLAGRYDIYYFITWYFRRNIIRKEILRKS